MEATATRGRPRKEYNTEEMALGELPPINLDADLRLNVRKNEEVLPVDAPLMSSHLANLAFMEEPVTIRIEKSSERYAATHVPVAVNGKGAEVLHDGKWIEVLYIETGKMLTTKRKYVEVLARAKPVDVKTMHEDTNVERPRNEIIRNVRAAYPITIVKDDNPKGHAWLTQIMAEG